jgi:hypothetical protein
MPSSTELTEITLSESRRKWTASAFGSLFMGSTVDRPARVTAGKLMYCGIKEPLFGSGWGPASGTATMVASKVAINTRAAGTAVLTADAVTSITITIKGNGYGAAPAVSFAGGGGTGAAGTAVLTSGRVTSVTITNGGSGYTTAPTVSFAAPDGDDEDQYPEYGTDFYLDTPDAGVMTGTVQVVECWYRELTNERSLPSEPTAEIELTSNQLHIISNSVAPSTEKYVSHREFYLNYTGKVGWYYLVARIPYTGGVDYTTVNISSTDITTTEGNRPLEDMRQCALYPAVRTAEFWRSRIWGAVLEPRSLETGAVISFFEGSDLITMAGDTFQEADYYKGIVDPATNNIVAYIDRVINSTTARIRLPGNLTDDHSWTSVDTDIEDAIFSGDEGAVYASPIYAGEAGGGITYGMLTWNALDTLRDESLYASGAKIGKIQRLGESLTVIYDRGVGVYQGGVSVDAPPQIRSFLSAENVGTFNPDSVWQTPDGSMWFQGNGRLWQGSAGNIRDASGLMGVAGFWRRFIVTDIQAQNIYQTAYNPETNMALMVGVPKVGENEQPVGVYAVAVAHDSNTVHGLRWPVAIKTVKCIRHDDTICQFYGSSGRRIYKLLANAVWKDSYYTAAGAQMDDQLVTISGTTGTRWEDGTIYTRDMRLCIETDATADIDLTIEGDVKKSNLISRTFTRDVGADNITLDELGKAEAIGVGRASGCAVQWRFSGEVGAELTLIHAIEYSDFLPNRRKQP